MNNVVLSGFLISLFSFFSASIVICNAPKKRDHILWGFFSLLVAVWSFCFSMTLLSQEYLTAYRWGFIHNFVALFIPVAFSHFSFAFLGILNLRKRRLYLYYGVTIFYALICLIFPHYFIESVSVKFISSYYYVDAGFLYVFFPFFYLWIVSDGILSNFYVSRTFFKIKKYQARVISWGYIFGGIGGATTFPLVFGYRVYPFGVWAVLVYVFIAAYALTKMQSQDFRVIITRSVSNGLILSVAAVSICVPYLLLETYPLARSVLSLSSALFWVFYGSKFRLLLQTSMEVVFIKDHFDTEFVMKQITEDILRIDDARIVLEFVASTLIKQVQVKKVWALYPDKFNSNSITFYSFVQLMSEKSNLFEFDSQHPMIAFFSSIKEIQYLGSISEISNVFLSPLMTTSRKNKELISHESLLVPIYSPNSFYGFLIIEPRLSEIPYYKSDFDFFDTISNYTAAIFDRIVHQEHLLFLNDKIAQLNQTLEKRVREELVLRQKALDAAHALSHRASLSTLTLGIAHEIRNPLTIIESSASYTLDLIQSRTKILKLMPDSKPVMNGSFIESDVTEFITQNPEITAELKAFLISQSILDSEGRPLENQNPIHPRFLLKLPQNHEMFHGKLLAYLKQIYAESQVINFLHLASRESKRVVTIADSMMMYGAIGEGLSRSAFTEQLGIESSERLWEELAQLGFLDSEGHITEIFTPDFREEDLALSAEFLPHRALIFKTMRGSQYALFKSFSVDDMINEIADLQRSHYRKLNIAMSIFLNYKKIIKGNPTTLRRVIMNLLSNAVEAMDTVPDGQKSISISSEPCEFVNFIGAKLKGIRISVTDSGGGISQDNLSKIHNPFFSTKNMTGGKNIGLGLSFVYQTIRRHNGVILVESELGKGTTFHVNLPGEILD